MPKLNLLPKREKTSLLKRQAPLPDPLARVEYTNDVEQDTKREFTALELAFKEQSKAEKASQAYANDTEFWFCAAFQSREQLEDFLRQLGFVGDEKYISGAMLAEKINQKISNSNPSAPLGIILQSYPEPTRSRKGLDKSLLALTEEVTG